MRRGASPSLCNGQAPPQSLALRRSQAPSSEIGPAWRVAHTPLPRRWCHLETPAAWMLLHGTRPLVGGGCRRGRKSRGESACGRVRRHKPEFQAAARPCSRWPPSHPPRGRVPGGRGEAHSQPPPSGGGVLPQRAAFAARANGRLTSHLDAHGSPGRWAGRGSLRRPRPLARGCGRRLCGRRRVGIHAASASRVRADKRGLARPASGRGIRPAQSQGQSRQCRRIGNPRSETWLSRIGRVLSTRKSRLPPQRGRCWPGGRRHPRASWPGVRPG